MTARELLTSQHQLLAERMSQAWHRNTAIWALMLGLVQLTFQPVKMNVYGAVQCLADPPPARTALILRTTARWSGDTLPVSCNNAKPVEWTHDISRSMHAGPSGRLRQVHSHAYTHFIQLTGTQCSEVPASIGILV